MLIEKLKALKIFLKAWFRDVFGNIEVKKAEVLNQIAEEKFLPSVSRTGRSKGGVQKMGTVGTNFLDTEIKGSVHERGEYIYIYIYIMLIGEELVV